MKKLYFWVLKKEIQTNVIHILALAERLRISCCGAAVLVPGILS